MKKVFILMLITLFVLSCGGNKETQGDGQINLTIWHSFTQGARKDFFENMARDFEVANPGVKITIEVFPWATFQQKWTSAASLGTLPDISSALPFQASEMILVDLLLPLNNVVNAIGEENFYERPLEAFTLDGNIYGISLYSHAHVMWYRKDILEANNIEVPETWEELYSAAQKVNNPPEYYGLSVPLAKTDFYGTLFLLLTSGRADKYILEKDGKVDLTSPEMLKSIQYWVDMYKAASPEGSLVYATKEQADLFYKGKSVFDFNSGFHVPGVLQSRPDLSNAIAAAPIPKWNKDDSDNGAYSTHTPIVIYKSTKHQQMSEKFVEFIFKPENYVTFLHSVPVGMLSSLRTVAQSPEFFDNDIIQSYSNEVNVIQNAVESGKPIGMAFGVQKGTGIIANNGIIEEMFQNIIQNNVPVEVAAKEAEDRLNSLIDS